MPDVSSTPVAMSPERPMPCRQCTAAFWPSLSAAAIVLNRESASRVDAGTPRSGIGNENKTNALRFGDVTFVSQFKLRDLVPFEQRHDNIKTGLAPTVDLVLEPVSASRATCHGQPPRHGPGIQNNLGFMLFLAGTAESEGTVGRRRWLQDLPQHGENCLEISVVLPNLFLQRLDLPRELPVSSQELTQVDECPDDLDAGTDCNGTFKNVREHHHPMLGEDVRQVLHMVSTL